MEKIIPRWEWRSFGSSFGEGEKTIAGSGPARTVEGPEVYILSRVSGNNVKIREERLEVKTLESVNHDRLERWTPALKAPFPVSAEEADRALSALGVPGAVPAGCSYGRDTFIEKLVKPDERLRLVDLFKRRAGYTLREARLEIADLTIDGVPIRTVCVEHADPDLVTSVVRELRFDRFENTNYVRAIKRITGMESL